MIAADTLMRGVVGIRMEAEGGIILAAGGEMAAAVLARERWYLIDASRFQS